MNNLVKIPNVLTMSSLEIAELTSKEHKNVLADIRNMLEQLGILAAEFSAVRIVRGKEYEIFNLPKRECLILVSGYSATLRAKIIDRWLDLEEKQRRSQLPSTYLEALRELVRAQEEVQKLNTLLDNEFGYCSILRAATYAGVHEKEFNWRPLKAMTLKLGMEVKKVPSPRYGYQNLYPIRAFEACYPDIDFDDLKPDVIEDKANLALV